MKLLFLVGVICGLNFCIGSVEELVPSQKVKIVVFVPASHGDAVREAMGAAGAGRFGNYDSCSFTMKGTGRWRPLEGAHPASGEVGKVSFEEEERIEAICPKDRLKEVLQAIRKVHPYEEIGFDIYPLLDVTL